MTIDIPRRRALVPPRIPYSNTSKSRVKSLPSLPPQMDIPYRALPQEPGKVVSFYGNLSGHDRSWVSWQSTAAASLVKTVAINLSSTEMAIVEAGYPERPSVIVLSGNMPKWTDSSIVEGLYGVTDEDGKELFFEESTPSNYRQFLFSDADMLANVMYDTSSHTHFFNWLTYLGGGTNEEQLLALVHSAQKYFDFVIFLTTSPNRFEIVNSKTSVIGTYKIVGDSYYGNVDSGKTVPVLFGRESYKELERVASRNHLLWFESNEAPNSSASTTSVRFALAQRFIRDFTAKDKPSYSVPVASAIVKKIEKESKKSPVIVEAPVLSSAGLFTALSSGTVAVTGAINPAIALSTGVLTALGMGAFATRKARKRREEEKNRLANEEYSRVFYDHLVSKDHLYSPYPIVAKTVTTSPTRIDLPKILDDNEAPSNEPVQSAPETQVEKQSRSTVTVDVPVKREPLSATSIKMVTQRISRLTDKWMSYELEPLKALDYPLMMDASCPETREFIRSYETLTIAKGIYDDESNREAFKELQDALEEAESAFLTAENNAKKMRLAHLTADQKKQVNKAKNLTAIALDEEASPHERVSAWKKASDCLEGIVYLPDRAVKGLLMATPA